MKNEHRWVPTKYVYRNGRLTGSRDTAEVAVGSRLISALVAACYQTAIAEHATGRLIDLGCGKVPLYATYRDYVTEIVCVDWENTQHPSEHLDYECDLSKPLPFDPGRFDTVILSDVLEHVSEPQQLCREVSRILSIGGKVLLSVPFFYWLHERPHDYFRYTEFGLRHLLESSGLQVVHVRAVGGSPEVLADLLAKHLARIPGIGTVIAAALQAAVGSFVRRGPGRRLSFTTSERLPLGYFVVAQRRAA